MPDHPGRQRIAPAGQPPLRFAFPQGRYSLRATVRHRGQLLFTTDTVTPVLDGSSQPVERLLRQLSQPPVGPIELLPRDARGTTLLLFQAASSEGAATTPPAAARGRPGAHRHSSGR